MIGLKIEETMIIELRSWFGLWDAFGEEGRKESIHLRRLISCSEGSSEGSSEYCPALRLETEYQVKKMY